MTDQAIRGSIEAGTSDPKSLVFLRIKLLEKDGLGFPSIFLGLVRSASDMWFDILSASRNSLSIPLAKEDATNAMCHMLGICRNICKMDQCLSEELGYQGLHVILTKIMKLDPYAFLVEEDQDTIMEVQDLACEIASISTSFPMKVAPFSHQELSGRLPLIFRIKPVHIEDDSSLSNYDGVTILINQVKARQSSQADVGFLMWPSAVVLSRYLLTHPDLVFDKDVLEIGSGCGLAGLVAGKVKSVQDGRKKTKVLLTDFNTTVVKNCENNILLNGLDSVAMSDQLDFFQQDIAVDGWLDSNGMKQKQVDLILAADVICQPEDAYAAARTIFCALKSGGKAIIVSADSKHRFGVERLEEACHIANLRVSSSTNIGDLYDGRLLCSSMQKTTGYVDGMSLTLYIVEKP